MIQHFTILFEILKNIMAQKFKTDNVISQMLHFQIDCMQTAFLLYKYEKCFCNANISAFDFCVLDDLPNHLTNP